MPTAEARQSTASPDQYGDDADAEFLAVEVLRRAYGEYIATKALEIEEQKEARRYYHAAHWTATEIKTLRDRGQPVITYNRIGRKINGIVGLIGRMRQDPKAYPRKPKNEEGAEVATAAVRYALDCNDWKTKENNCALRCATEGIAGIELKLSRGDHGDPHIELHEVDCEDFFYSVWSYRPDFSDSRHMGLGKWLDVEEAIELFPDKEEELRSLVGAGSDLSTNADREFKFAFVSRNRLRLVEHWYKYKGNWCWAFYVGMTLLDEGISPFYDERGKTICRFIMYSAAVDHDGDRYGFVRNLKGPQDEINQRRSKALHISNSRRLIIDKGAVDNVETARREWARPDGIIEKNPGLEVKPDDTSADLAAQFQFLEEAKNEIGSFANTDLAQTIGPMAKNLSGRAINMLQQPGMAELGMFIGNFKGWKIRVYRAIWSMAQRYWTAERWIRVTDDENVPQFLQVNGLDLDEYGQPVLVNALGQLDVDIILDEGPDVVNMMADTYDQLSQRADVPFPILLELMPIQGSVKRKIQTLLQQSADPAQQIAKKLAINQAQAKIDETKASADQKAAGAIEKRAKAVMDSARAAHLASESHLNAAEFGLKAIREAALGPASSPDGAGPLDQGGNGMPQQPQPQPPVPSNAPAFAG